MKSKLPISEIIPDIKRYLNNSNRLVLQAPPGAGKTTSVPLELMNEPWLNGRKIVMLEPRRIAARSAAYWMAKSINESVGNKIGYSVHLDRKVSEDTLIEVVTEGVFINRLIKDPELTDTALVIFDEFHERSMDADLALALVRECQEILREDLKILVMSATLDAQPIAEYLDNSPILSSEGKSFPVNIKYLTPKDDHLINSTVSAVIDAINNEDGSILVFLPGVGEIKRAESVLKDKLPGDILVQPLYGALPREEQERAIEPVKAGDRKVVLATSIAESSITINGVRVVIDTGLIRKPQFNPKTGMDSLETLKISKASADQRTGRAGRVEPGICYRLWSEYQKLDDYSEPSIIHEYLTGLVLTIIKWGYSNIDDVRWITRPNESIFRKSFSLLESLGAVDKTGITDKGEKLVRLPLHPRLGNMVVDGEKMNCRPLACDIAALLSERDILTFPKETSQSDILFRLDALKGKSIIGARVNGAGLRRVRDYSRSISRGNRSDDTSNVSILLMSAYPDRIAKRIGDGLYQMVNGSSAVLSDTDTLYHSEFLVVPSLGGTGKVSKIFIASMVEKRDILALFKDSLDWTEKLSYDRNRNKFSCRSVLKLGHITLKEERISNVSDSEFHDALCGYLKATGLGDLNWSKEALKFRDRVNFLHSHEGKNYPDFSDASLLTELNWLVDYLPGITLKSSLKDIPLLGALKGFFDYSSLKTIDNMAPTHIEVPSGSNIPIDYSTGDPVLKVRLQELFGLTVTPTVLNGKIPIIIHLLSPASRPIQITRDLKSFWDNTYIDVKKDLKGRYPKHYWPDDPYNAKATNRIKKK